MNESILFIDCSANPFIVGILNAKHEWEMFFKSEKNQDFFSLLYNVLREKNKKLNQFKQVIVCMGPGSYSGLRQSFLFSEVLRLEKEKIFSFYHSEFLKIVSSYTHKQLSYYVAYAFKNSFYVENLSLNIKGQFVATENLADWLVGKAGFAGKAHELFSHLKTFENIDHLYFQYPELLINIMVPESMKQRPVDYFRPAELEFPNFK